MGAYKNRFIADFVPKDFRPIGKNENVKTGDYYWSRGSYFLVNEVMVGHKNKLPVVRKIHEPTKTNNSIMQFGAS